VSAAIKLFAALSAPFVLADFQPVAVIIKPIAFIETAYKTLIIYFSEGWVFKHCFKINQIACPFKNISRKVRSGHRFYSDGTFLQLINNSVTEIIALGGSHTWGMGVLYTSRDNYP